MFQKDFVWGVASSAFQIEGRDENDGCGKTVWDVYCEEGKVNEGQNGLIACDHIHRFAEDFALMRIMGVKNYRFSMNWARILPKGTGEINQAGLDYYKNLICEMKKNGITPYITMFHWEFPQALQERGGWLNPDCVHWFADYAKVIAENFSEDCEYFITFNEPQCFLGLGYLRGFHAPGFKRPAKEVFAMTHNVLKAHGAAVKTLRKYAKRPIQIGFAPTCGVALPATNSPEDIEAARRRYLGLNPEFDNWTWNVSWFLDPVMFGTYPEDGLQAYKEYLPEITKEDMELICQPLDFLGQNVYNGYTVRMGEDGETEYVDRYEGFPKTATNWPVTPECLYWGARFLCEKYHMPLYITENGMSCHDVISEDGMVHDPNRIDYLDQYIYQLQKAVDEGYPVKGYFMWSFLDNFEWDKGYSERFGIVYVDYPTQKRIVKDSAYWYKDIMESNGAKLSGNHPKKEMFVLQPVLKEKIWGGSKLKTQFGFATDSEKIGECWGISAHANGDCIVTDGIYAGMHLSELYRMHRELFGNLTEKEFPLMVKMIDAQDKLSIQVHPDDAYAAEHENGSFGKMEMWYVLDAEQDAKLIVGHNAATKEEFQAKIEAKDYETLLRCLPVKKGDLIKIHPGTIHAINGGIVVLEIQQSSDITYRLYDYDRLENGVPRELHIEKSLDVINVPDRSTVNAVPNYGVIPEDVPVLIESNAKFRVWKLNLKHSISFEQKEAFLLINVISGDGVINGRRVESGAGILLPANYGKVQMAGEMEVIFSAVGVE